MFDLMLYENLIFDSKDKGFEQYEKLELKRY